MTTANSCWPERFLANRNRSEIGLLPPVSILIQAVKWYPPTFEVRGVPALVRLARALYRVVPSSSRSSAAGCIALGFERRW